MLTIDQIIAKMRANYEPVVKSLPVELQEEFRTKVLPLAVLEELASFINTSSEFEGRAAIGLTQRKIERKVTVMSFSKKLIESGIRSDEVYGGLLKGCFVFE
jgi:hypothetical protein